MRHCYSRAKEITVNRSSIAPIKLSRVNWIESWFICDIQVGASVKDVYVCVGERLFRSSCSEKCLGKTSVSRWDGLSSLRTMMAILIIGAAFSTGIVANAHIKLLSCPALIGCGFTSLLWVCREIYLATTGKKRFIKWRHSPQVSVSPLYRNHRSSLPKLDVSV